jgi:threonine dehydrogenase-like Zn-dependent dehydrogenase
VRAVRLAGAKRLEVIELPDPEPGDGEVLVRVAATGICGSDLSCYKTGVFSGSVLGHEFSGFVDGDPVVVDPKMPCGACADCRNGASYRCVEALTRGPGGMRDGAFAELVAVPASCVHRLPAGLDVANACLVEPLSVAIHGVERAGIVPDEATVVGLGPIGLLAVATLRARGCANIVGVDPVMVRRTLAEKLGAGTVHERIEDAPAGTPLVLECTGRPELLQQTTNLLAPGGVAVLLGVPMSEASVVPMVWVTREQSVVGSISSSEADFRAAIELLADHPEIADIITKRVTLDELPNAFEELTTRPADGKVVVDPRRSV